MGEAGGLHAPADRIRHLRIQVALFDQKDLNLAGKGLAEGRNLERMREPIVDVVDVCKGMHLRLTRQTAERRGEDDALVVDLERRARISLPAIVVKGDRIPVNIDPQRGEQLPPAILHFAAPPFALGAPGMRAPRL